MDVVDDIFRGGAKSKNTVKKIAKNAIVVPQDFALINGGAIQDDNPMNGTNNTSVPLFDDANLVQEGDGILVVSTVADGTIFIIRSPGIYRAKLQFVAAPSQALQGGIARNPSSDFSTDAIDGAAVQASVSTQNGLIKGTRVTTPADCELPITVSADILVNGDQLANEFTLSDGSTVQQGVCIVPLTFDEAGAGSPNGIDIAVPRDNFHFQLTRLTKFAQVA